MLTTGSNDSLTDNNEKFQIRAIYQGVLSFQAQTGTKKPLPYRVPKAGFSRAERKTLIMCVILFESFYLVHSIFIFLEKVVAFFSGKEGTGMLCRNSIFSHFFKSRGAVVFFIGQGRA